MKRFRPQRAGESVHDVLCQPVEFPGHLVAGSPRGDDIHVGWFLETLRLCQGSRRRSGETVRDPALRNLTNLGEPQSAAGPAAPVPRNWAGQSRMARVGSLESAVIAFQEAKEHFV